MLGTLKTSPVSARPIVAAMTALRTNPVSREATVPAAMTAPAEPMLRAVIGAPATGAPRPQQGAPRRGHHEHRARDGDDDPAHPSEVRDRTSNVRAGPNA